MRIKTRGSKPTQIEKGLAILNIVCALLHFAFQVNIYRSNGIYRSLLLIENILIGFVFLYCFVGFLWGEQSHKKSLLIFQLIWWSVFIVLVIFNWGVVSTLSMFNPWLVLPQSIILVVTGMLGVSLAIFGLRSKQEKVSAGEEGL